MRYFKVSKIFNSNNSQCILKNILSIQKGRTWWNSQKRSLLPLEGVEILSFGLLSRLKASESFLFAKNKRIQKIRLCRV